MLTGEKLGRYEIGQMIGAGGMGEVYIAHDDQLDRDVALKVLLPEFCCQEDRVKRFKFEAKAVSALNHPSIITIHEIEEINDKLFIATELVDGKTLRERIEAGDLDTYEIVKIAEQVADALSVAHEANIVHRDIKPENIMIRKDGLSKILDFGLAKPIIENVSGNLDQTIHMVKTQPGLVMGSVRYMSPEQARGKETNGRTDVWSLGVVLYELLTGENPFDGETISDSLAAVIHKQPGALKDVPENLGLIIEKALNKDPDERYQDIKDFALDLHDIRMSLERDSGSIRKEPLANTITLSKQNTSENKTLIHSTISTENTTGGGDVLESKRNNPNNSIANSLGGRRNVVFASIAILGIVAMSGLFLIPRIFGETKVPFQSIQVSRFTDTGNSSRAAVSPDGKMVTFVENRENQGKLLLRQIKTGGTVEIVPFTDKGFYQPTFSPDGEFIYYTLHTNGVGILYKIPTLGGKSIEIIGDIDSSVTFSPNGERLAFIRHNAKDGGSDIVVANNDGGNSEKLIYSKEIEFERFKDLNWSSDGSKILISGFAKSDVDYKKVKVITIDVKDKSINEPTWITQINEQFWWSADNFVWLKDNSGVVFIGNAENTDTRQVHHISFANGKVSRVTNDISNYESLSISDDAKTLVANKVDMLTKLSAYMPTTNETKDVLAEDKKYSFYAGFTQTSDGKLVYTKNIDGGMSVFKVDKDGANEETLLSELKHNFNPVITADNKYILFRGAEKGHSVIWRSDIDGTNQKQLTNKDLGYVSDMTTSPDGKFVYFTKKDKSGGKMDILKIPIDGGEVSEVLPNEDLSLNSLSFSKKGDRVAYRTSTFDTEAQKFDAKIVIAEFDGEAIGEKIIEYEMPIELVFQWSPDGKNITFVKKEGSDNLWNLNIEDGKQTQLTNLKSEFIPYFIWSNKGDKIFLVDGKVNNDLVLIKSEDIEQ